MIRTHISRRPVLAGLLAVALVVTLLFGGRAAWRLGQRLLGPPPPPRETNVAAIEGWMSVGYITRAYRIPPPELLGALGVSPEGRRPSTLDDIARETGRSSEEVVRIARETVRAWQESHPPPGPDGPGRSGGGPGGGPRPDGPRLDEPDGPRRDGPGGEPNTDRPKPAGALSGDAGSRGGVTGELARRMAPSGVATVQAPLG